MEAWFKFGGSGGYYGQSTVDGIGDEEADFKMLKALGEEAKCDPDSMDESVSGIVDYFVEVTKDDLDGKVLFRKEGRIADKSGALELEKGQYALRCLCGEEGIWQTGRLQVPDADLERHVAKYLKAHGGKRGAALSDYFGARLVMHTASVTGFATVCESVGFPGLEAKAEASSGGCDDECCDDECCDEDWACPETDGTGEFLSAVDSTGRVIDLDAPAPKKRKPPKPAAKKRNESKPAAKTLKARKPSKPAAKKQKKIRRK